MVDRGVSISATVYCGAYTVTHDYHLCRRKKQKLAKRAPKATPKKEMISAINHKYFSKRSAYFTLVALHYAMQRKSLGFFYEQEDTTTALSVASRTLTVEVVVLWS